VDRELETATVTLAPGSRIGPYEVLAVLGAGGMGEVWKARDTRLDRIVAIKRLTQHTERFEQEARAIAALNHPHICQIYDVGPDYLVLEYVEGRQLQGPLPVNDAIRLAIQIASALEEAHARGILHRDLKPANVMVTPQGGAKLLDFGLAKLLDADADVTRTLDGTVVGTAAYMSPEQAEGKALDTRSDIFSFGAVLYEMLSGTRAFAGQTSAQVVTAILRDGPPPLQAPAALDRIVRRCLEKAPARRFQSIGDVRAAFEQLTTQPADRQPSIAVLPFADMSAGKDHEWFSDGLSEEIINALTHVPGLKVTARTSAFAFRGKEQDITKIAEALRVRTILEGSVRRAGDRIRVTAQLINAEDGYHLWSERYDRDVTDIFAIQDDIARAIAGALQIQLSGKHGAPRQHTPNLAAYESYLKGRHYLYKMTAESLQRSRQFFEQAIDLDPDFAQAHSGLGEHFFVMASVAREPEDDMLRQARAEVRRALDIDSSLPEAHVLLGMVASAFDYDWPAAEREFKAAMAHEPVSPYARDHYGAFYLLQIGRIAEAGAAIERALQEDPLNLLFRVHWATYLFAAGRDADAVGQYLEVLDIDQNYYLAHAWIAAAYASRGMWLEARRHAEHLFALGPTPLTAGWLAGVADRAGDRERHDQLLEQLEDRTAPGTALGLAMFYLCVNVDEALTWIAKAIERRELRLVLFPVLFRRFCSSSPRWPAVAKLLNLPA
jgi:eukaryotic-like serine/threonine-protein kinase